MKKAFQEWKFAYGVFAAMCFPMMILLAWNETKDGIDSYSIVGLILVFAAFHLIFILIKIGIDNDKKRALENETWSLKTFADKYELSEEQSIQLLKDGKVEGDILFKAKSLRNQTKDDIHKLL